MAKVAVFWFALYFSARSLAVLVHFHAAIQHDKTVTARSGFAQTISLWTIFYTLTLI